jgi:rod shape-determining protein MreB
MHEPHRHSSVIKAELETFRSALPPKWLKLPNDDPSTAQEIQVWRNHEYELAVELTEALVAEAAARFGITDLVIQHSNQKDHNHNPASSLVVIAVPSGITEIENRTVQDFIMAVGVRQVYLIEKPMASALGAGLSVHEPDGSMIVDIGTGGTEIAIISADGIVFSRSLRVGGNQFAEAIQEHIQRAHNLMVDERTAKEIKAQIGTSFPMGQELTMEIQGRNLSTDLPTTITIRSEEIRECLQEPLANILESILITLERCPPELRSGIALRGIVLAGGGALLKGIDRLISEEIGLPAKIADEPMNTLTEGLKQLQQQITLFMTICSLQKK